MDYTIKELEKKLKMSRFKIMRLAKEHHWETKKAQRGKVKVNLYSKADINKFLGKTKEKKEITVTKVEKKPVTIDDLPTWNQSIAWARYIICNKTAEMMTTRKKLSKKALFTEIAKNFKEYFPQQSSIIKKISESTLHRWFLMYEKEPTNPLILASLHGAKKGKRAAKKEVLEDAKNIYFSKNKVSIMYVYERLVDKYGPNAIGYSTLRNFIREDIDNIEKDRARMGLKEFKDKHLPFIVRDYTTLAVNDLWVSDGHDMELSCYHPFKKNNKGDRLIVSPKLIVWMDMRSRMLVGYHVSFEETTEAIAIALKNGIQKYGVPKEVYTDNGKAYKSKVLKGTDELLGIYASLGIKARHAIPYNAQAKPIERWFLDFKETFAKSSITYKGGNVLERPEHLKKVLKDKILRGAILELDELIEAVEKYIQYKNHNYYEIRRLATNKGHRGHGMNNMTPAELVRSEEGHREFIPEEKLRLLFLYEEIRTVGQNGVTYLNNTYIHEQLFFLLGQKIKIKYDPHDLTFVYAYKQTGEFICKATLLNRASFTSIDGIKDHKRRVKKIIKAEKEIVDTRGEMRDILGVIEDSRKRTMQIEHKKQTGKKKTVYLGQGLEVEIE